MQRLLLCLSAASIASAPAASTAQAYPPACGARALDIGDGFLLTQYMFAGAPEFMLEYSIPDEQLRSDDVVMGTRLQLVFAALANSYGDDVQIGYQNFDIRTADGEPFEYGRVDLDCGNGRSLSQRFVWNDQFSIPHHVNLFGSWQEKQDCLWALRKTGSFKLSFARDMDGEASLIFAGPIPLKAKIDWAHRHWRNELAKAADGACRIVPPPPRIGIPPPPPPPGKPDE